ncbi:MAG: PP2C family protein-serine/threonine phosphatase [Moorea sp. SIO2B7]|nr:PP2C family protein-serine/threonine phosphatase [Moorena sp. SIO2B7]
MLAILNQTLELIKSRCSSRLSQKIIFWFFLSIVVIEGLILIPSVKRKEKELLAQLQEISSAKITWIIMTYPELSGEELLTQVAQLPSMANVILGGVLYKSNGSEIGNFGKLPELSFEQFNKQNKLTLYNGYYYDAVWEETQLSGNYILIIRQDASDVKGELLAYIIRIIGLVVIISAFITVTVWMALEPLVIAPIFQLRFDLIGAGEAISKDKEPPQFYSTSIKRKDELGDVIIAFQEMFRQITEAISARKKAELELQKSLETVQTYSEALDKELDKGREIQRNFLPTEIPNKPSWEIAAFFKPARQVAGDFYDVFEIGDSLGLVIADVCDKGVGASLFMALFRSLIRIFSAETRLRGNTSTILEANLPANGAWMGESPSTNLAHINALQAVSLTNNYVAEYHGEMGMFATLFFGVLEPSTGLLTYINGGHEPLFILHNEGGVKEHLNSTGPAVGMLPDLKFKIKQTYLKPGEILLGYTDGIPEARAADGKFFSGERLLSILEFPIDSAQSLLDKIAEDVIKHTGEAEQFDDITMLAVQHLSTQ